MINLLEYVVAAFYYCIAFNYDLSQRFISFELLSETYLPTLPNFTYGIAIDYDKAQEVTTNIGKMAGKGEVAKYLNIALDYA